MRILVIAERANPEWTSVPLVGWSHAQALRQKFDVHLVTQIRNRDAILAAGLVEGRDFTALDTESWDRPIVTVAKILRGGGNKGWTAITAAAGIAYYNFERQLWRTFGSSIRQGEFSVVHRITPLSPTIPSLMAKKCAEVGVPFVLGPLNGGVKWPQEFNAARRQEREWLSYVRGCYRLLPGFKSTRTHASAIVIGSRDTWNQMPSRYHDKCFYIPENGVDPARFPFDTERAVSDSVRVVFVGRVVPYKGADMLIEAAATLLRERRMSLEIIGDGPQLPDLKKIAHELGITQNVHFSGWVQHGELHERLSRADVFGFPSIREFGGGAVLETMAMGLVPIVVDYGGPAELVTDQTGYKVPLGNRAEIIRGLANVLNKIVAQPAELKTKSSLARARVLRHFTWTAKAEQMSRIYHWACGRAEKPSFTMPVPDDEPTPSKEDRALLSEAR